MLTLYRLYSSRNIAFHIHTVTEVLAEHTPQIIGNAPYTSFVMVHKGWLPVRVGIDLMGSMDNPFGMFRKIAVYAYAILDGSLREDLVLFTQLLLTLILLENDKVASDFCIGFVHEQIVRQADGRNKVSLFHHHKTGTAACFRVQQALRGDERHDAAVTHGIQSFQEEIVVYMLCRLLTERISESKGRVKHGYISERNVGHRHIETVKERFLYLLKTLYAYLLVGMKMFQQLACKQILFKCHYIGIGIVLDKRIHERTASGRGFEQHLRLYAVTVQYLRQYIGNLFRCVECRKYGCFQ